MQLYQNWTSPGRPQETLIESAINNLVTKKYSETPLNRNSHHIEAIQLNWLALHDTTLYQKVFPNRPKRSCLNS